MTTEQISMSAFRSIWSALHFPNEPNHCGNKVLDLFKTNAMSPFQKGLFDDLGKNKTLANASVVMVEMQNLLIGNSNLTNQVVDAMQAGVNDSKIDMPPIDMPSDESNYQPAASNNDSGMSFGEIINIILTIVSVIGLIAKCSR